MVFGVLYAADGSEPGAVVAVARDFSPRIEIIDAAREVVIDLGGLSRLFGDARTMGEELRRSSADRGLRVRVAVAATRTAARLLVRHRAGVTVVTPGEEALAVAPLPLDLLGAVHGPAGEDPSALIATLRRWGLRTLGQFAALAGDEVAARLGQAGVRWQQIACGRDGRPLVPSVPEERFEQALDLEWPIEGLEPLSFVLGRLLDPLSAHLDRRGRGAAVLHVRLHLVTREVHARSLQLPVAMRDPRALRTLLLLDLESHPPAAAIDRVVVAVDPTPARVVQFSLLTRPLPSPEQISTLMARLQALMGESRCGSPQTVDSWEPGAYAMAPVTAATLAADVAPGGGAAGPPIGADEAVTGERPRGLDGCGVAAIREDAVREDAVREDAVREDAVRPVVALRRFRVPVAIRVSEESGRPAHVSVDRAGLPGGRVVACAGPWRTSGAWWVEAAAESPRAPRRAGGGWDRDEWDVALSDGATCRIFRERGTGRWFIDGEVD